MITNFLLFHIGWFACILGGAWHMPWLGPAYAAAIIILHLSLVRIPKLEGQLILLAGIYGLCADSLLASMGRVSYNSGVLIEGAAPYWIIALWMLFATTLNIAFHWLKRRYLLATVLGAISGPLAYLGGEKLGAATLVNPSVALFALALIWGSAMPILVFFAERWNGVSNEAPNFINTKVTEPSRH
ncbi:MAG: DUF2878 domain-containing protein [Pseudomonadota bacterium]